MNVTQKSDLEKMVAYLKKTAEQEQDYRERAAFINVACVLEQALENHCEDEQHPHLYLEIVKAPNLLDSAINDSCTNDCLLFGQGTCPFLTADEKQSCPRIWKYLKDNSEAE